MKLRLFFAALICNAGFGDPELKRWTEAHRNGLILIVSDGMPYSQVSAGSVAQEAAKRKMPLLILSDREGPKQKSRCDALVKSDRLIEKGALRHFPSLFFVKDHQLQNHVIPGIQTPTELNSTLNEIYSP